MTSKGIYAGRVFINCPFDAAYLPLLHAIIFAVVDAGFTPRSALELDDSSEVRIEKILNLIGECKFAVHDLSRTERDATTGLPRFNMPLELGIFLGAKRFGEGKQKQKNALIFDVEKYRYQRFISDIAGQDIRAHNGDPEEAIKALRNWLNTSSKRKLIPGGAKICERYGAFQTALPAICARLRLDPDTLTYGDYVSIAGQWLKETTWN